MAEALKLLPVDGLQRRDLAHIEEAKTPASGDIPN
jgi:hypothetical protein